MTVADLITELHNHPADMPVGIRYDMQKGFYPAFEVKQSLEGRAFTVDGVAGGTTYLCVCDRP